MELSRQSARGRRPRLQDRSAGVLNWPIAVTSGDYRDVNLTIKGGSIHAGSILKGLFDPLGTFIISNVDAVIKDSGLHFSTPATPGLGSHSADIPA